MTKQYTIELTDTQDLAFDYVTAFKQDWVDGFIKHRCNKAIDDIVRVATEKCFETNTQVPATKDELVALAFQEGWVETAAQAMARQEAERLAAQQTPQE
jgi:hypothetical protein